MPGLELLSGGLAVAGFDEDDGPVFVVCKVTADHVDLIRPGEPVRSFPRADVAPVTMPRHGVACTRCGRWWVQRGNRTGHCAACHHTFEGLALFDAHQRQTPDGSAICLNPASMWWRGHRLRLVEGTWRGPGMRPGAFGGDEA